MDDVLLSVELVMRFDHYRRRTLSVNVHRVEGPRTEQLSDKLQLVDLSDNDELKLIGHRAPLGTFIFRGYNACFL